jgi:hypothetical protein
LPSGRDDSQELQSSDLKPGCGIPISSRQNGGSSVVRVVGPYGFVDAKLRDLGSEKRRLEDRREALETTPYDPIDADAVLRGGLASLHDLPRLLESGSIEDRKEFARAFVGGVSVVPGEARLDIQMRTLPALSDANSTCGLVAGAGFEPATFGL